MRLVPRDRCPGRQSAIGATRLMHTCGDAPMRARESALAYCIVAQGAMRGAHGRLGSVQPRASTHALLARAAVAAGAPPALHVLPRQPAAPATNTARPVQRDPHCHAQGDMRMHAPAHCGKSCDGLCGSTTARTAAHFQVRTDAPPPRAWRRCPPTDMCTTSQRPSPPTPMTAQHWYPLLPFYRADVRIPVKYRARKPVPRCRSRMGVAGKGCAGARVHN
jgi:hypothetical protein